MNKIPVSGVSRALLARQLPAPDAPVGAPAFRSASGAALPRQGRLRLLALGVALALAVGIWLWFQAGRQRPHESAWRPLEKRPFPVLLRESGTVVAKNETYVFSRFTGEVVWKIEDGMFVEPGAVVVRFNATSVLDELDRMKKELFDKEEAVRRARDDFKTVTRRYELEIPRQQAALDKAALDRNLAFARPIPDERREAELAFASAQLKVQQVSREYESHQELHAAGFVTAAVLKQKALKLAGERADHAKAKILLQLTLQGPSKDAKRLADLSVAEAKMNLDTAVFNRDADLAIKKAELDLNEIELENFKTALELKQRELEDAEVKAAVPGRVAFVDVFKGSGSLSPIQVGESRSRGQELCKIVNTNILRVKVLTNEADVAKLLLEQPASVRLPAFPGRAFKGRVAEVALVAQDKNVALSSLALRRAGEAFVNVVAVYIDFVELSNADRAAIRLGFTAQASIDAGASGAAWVLPWTAIAADPGGKPWVTARQAGGRAERRVVTLGRSDADFVEVLDGLAGCAEVLDQASAPATSSGSAPE